ncbi:hypothetical protein REC12_19410 [Desulfosporosinus sp. PR]|uniref:type IV pilus modification PilV family protein n=1 Tax=Candidatus Desulfosporosinus nitrosoreducens TaxID=3401928 RepID=UPI0027F6E7F5|nr:hypothetical protein [Desulfosporosinus sp. PR]MDQ7095763.1 hypothetical protein [Desulfosporosinus sp. PR]
MATGKDGCAKGYILFDVLLAVFLYSIGFMALFGLIEEGIFETRQAFSLLAGANLAQSIMDQLAAHSWKENIAAQACIPGGIVEGQEGDFHWFIHSEWGDLPQLLRTSVEVRWVERGKEVQYKLESLYEVE